MDCRYRGKESVCFRCSGSCYGMGKFRDVDCCDSKGVDNFNCKYYSCYDIRCFWRELFMVLVEILKGGMNYCIGLIDYFIDVFLLGFSDCRLGLIF